MGKKAKHKQIRKAVLHLPQLFQLGVTQVDKLTGHELIAKGVTEIGGKPVEPEANYRQIQKGGVAINHERRMKDIYAKRGMAAVNQYIREVFYFAKMEEINKKKKEQSHDDELPRDDSQAQVEDHGDTSLRG